MRDVKRVADDLYLVKHPSEDGFVGVIVVLGKCKIGLVDTGFALGCLEIRWFDVGYLVSLC